jgi:hypothetical protein
MAEVAAAAVHLLLLDLARSWQSLVAAVAAVAESLRLE